MKHMANNKSTNEAAKQYAERACNGEFPITYTRDQVVNHTAGDFLAGVDYFKNIVLGILKENQSASKELTEEDKKRPAQEMVDELYEDFIAIFESR